MKTTEFVIPTSRRMPAWRQTGWNPEVVFINCILSIFSKRLFIPASFGMAGIKENE